MQLLIDIPLSISMKKIVFHVLKGEDVMEAFKDFLSGKGSYIVFIILTMVMLAIFFLSNLNEDDEEELFLPLQEEVEMTIAEENNELQMNIIVDIKGEVSLAGVYEVEEGDRVHDAINKAGGFTTEANQSAINLAERCYDEMVIYVPSINEEDTNQIIIGSAGGSVNAKQEGILINQADATELTVLPGIGPAKAEAIVTFREENGPFKSAEDITKVPGIGEKTVDSFRDRIIIK